MSSILSLVSTIMIGYTAYSLWGQGFFTVLSSIVTPYWAYKWWVGFGANYSTIIIIMLVGVLVNFLIGAKKDIKEAQYS